MKKLYQVKIKAKIERPKELSKEEFSKIIEGKELVENLVLCASETEDDAAIIALEKYIEATTSNITDYKGVILRGEFRNEYYLVVNISKDGQNPIQTRIIIDLFPEDLGI